MATGLVRAVRIVCTVGLGAGIATACASSASSGDDDNGAPTTDAGSRTDASAADVAAHLDSGHPDSAAGGSDSGSTSAARDSGTSGTTPVDSGSGSTTVDSGAGTTKVDSGTVAATPDAGMACTATASGGTAGWASRFWDCCRPSCSNSGANVCDSGGTNHVSTTTTSACSGGSAFACFDYSPIVVNDCMAYGFAAFNSGSCGTCYQLTFTGTAANGGGMGAQKVKGKQMIVQVVNIGGIQANQFDIMIPGGGVGALDACMNQWKLPTAQLGAQYGGFMTTCEQQSNTYATQEQCVQTACATLPTGLQPGCNWYVSWLLAADNPDVMYQEVTCPSQLTQISGIQ